jgi:hypothetical protein
MCRLLDVFKREDHARRLALSRLFVVLLTVVPVLMYFVFRSPVKMVVAGGIAQSVLLPALGFGALHLHHRCLPEELRPRPLVTVGLWAAFLGMASVTGYSLYLTLRAGW